MAGFKPIGEELPVSRSTKNYRFSTLELGDVWYPETDRQNFLTAENQSAAIMRYLGPGVLSGWQVTKMVGTSGTDPVLDAAVALDRAALLAAYTANPDSAIGLQYQILGLPTAESDWGQIIRITQGIGNVGLYPAQTVATFYFRYAQAGLFYVWAEAGQCLISDGRAVISAPLDGNYDYDLTTTATYLATIAVASVNGTLFVDKITYEDRRQELKNLQGQLDAALREVFYKHVHSGLPGAPSKISLATSLTLTGDGPTGSTIFRLLDKDGVAFTWKLADYGIPIVRVGEQTLPLASYTIDSAGGRLYLKNSLPAGTPIRVFLPLSPQVSLSLRSPSVITDAKLALTDGVSAGVDSDGNDMGPRLYTWDPATYRDPDVFVSGQLLDPAAFTALPDEGAILLRTPLTSPPHVAADLLVLLPKVGDQIMDKLSGKRLTNVDAASFAFGKLDNRRVVGLDHVGQVRLRETAFLRPSLRLFAFPDHTTFAPEIPNTPLQYATEIFAYGRSVNIPAPALLTGTKRGLMVQANGAEAQMQSGWNTDNGRPFQFQDELFPPLATNRTANDLSDHERGPRLGNEIAGGGLVALQDAAVRGKRSRRYLFPCLDRARGVFSGYPAELPLVLELLHGNRKRLVWGKTSGNADRR